jgi:predicted nucleotidyltransferase
MTETTDHAVPCAAFHTLARDFARVDTTVGDLVKWQERQNGSLGKLADRQEALNGKLEAAVNDRKAAMQAMDEKNEKRVDAVRAQIDALKLWLIALLGGVVANLAITLAKGP